jgi:hypothetical protein
MLNTGNTRKKFPKKVNIPYPTKQTPTHLDLEIKKSGHHKSGKPAPASTLSTKSSGP